MEKVNVEQGSPEWFAARTGVASASNFDRVVTASGKASTQADAYLYELTAEWITGEKISIRPSYWMERGTNMEPQARAHYKFITGNQVEEVGFVYKSKLKTVGCSPDGLVHKPLLAPKKGLEIKCPAPITHVSYLLQGVCPKQYLPQVQGSMWVTGLNQWDFMSFHPDYEPLVVTIDRDPVWMEAFDKIVVPFVDQIRVLRRDKRVIQLRDERIKKENA